MNRAERSGAPVDAARAATLRMPEPVDAASDAALDAGSGARPSTARAARGSAARPPTAREDRAPAPPQRPPRATPPSMPRVLVVDDTTVTRVAVASLLARAGFSVSTASDGCDALLRLASGPKPAVVVTDLAMPSLDGLGLCAAMAASPELAAIPVVVFSGDAARAAHAPNVRAALEKAASAPEDLVAAVRRLVAPR